MDDSDAPNDVDVGRCAGPNIPIRLTGPQEHGVRDGFAFVLERDVGSTAGKRLPAPLCETALGRSLTAWLRESGLREDSDGRTETAEYSNHLG